MERSTPSGGSSKSIPLEESEEVAPTMFVAIFLYAVLHDRAAPIYAPSTHIALMRNKVYGPNWKRALEIEVRYNSFVSGLRQLFSSDKFHVGLC